MPRLSATGAANTGFVGRQGTTFVRDGVPFRPTGVNFYSAAGDAAIFTVSGASATSAFTGVMTSVLC